MTRRLDDHDLAVIDMLNDILMLFEIQWGEPSKHYDNRQLVETILANIRYDMNVMDDRSTNEHTVRHWDRRDEQKDDSE